MADLIGAVLDDRYRVIERVGEGAMGAVYRAERVKLGRIVAVKVMNEALQDQSARARFEREAMAMAKLEHPHCAAVVDVGVHGDSPYVVMEFVTGKTLKQLIEAGAPPIPRAVDLVRQILSGLAHAHEHGVIHRDIKPANIVLSQKAGLGDHVKILDFGLARFNKESSNLTKGFVLGTPNYMAPEQIRGADFDQRIDLYACGVVLFELLTGQKPFRSDSNDPVQICMQHLNVKPPRLADVAKGGSFGALEDVVARALAKNRDERFQTAEEMSRAMVDAVGKPAAAQSAVNATMQLDPDLAIEPSASVTNVAAAKPAAPDTTPVADGPLTAATVAAKPASPPRKGRAFVLIGAGAVAAAVVTLVIATRGDAQPTKASPAAAPAPAHAPVAKPEPEPVIEMEPPPADPIAPIIEKARSLADANRRDAGIDVLLAARKTYPKDARLPYHAALLYLDKMWWDDGLKLARAAIELEPSYRSDPELIKLVVRGFNTTKNVDYTLARFLRKDLGPAVKPFLEEVAAKHKNPIVRKRAKGELRHYP